MIKRWLLLLIILLLMSCKETIDKVGIVKSVGNAPVNILVFETSDFTFQLPRSDIKKYSKYQQKTVRIIGTVEEGINFGEKIYILTPDSIFIQ